MNTRFTLPVIVAVILFQAGNAAAQNTNQSILLKSGTISPEKNIAEFISEKINPSEVVDGFYYRLIQFNNIPGEKEKERINAAGIKLLSYLPHNAYMAAIPESFNRVDLEKLDARAVIEWKKNFKIHRDLSGTSFPPHCIQEKGMVDLVVLYQKNILPARAKELFEAKGYRIIQAQNSLHSFTLRISDSKLVELSSLPFVYYIEPVSEPPVKDDTEGRSLHRSNVINADYATGRHYNGSGVTIAIADDGEIGPHIDFTGRVTEHLTGFGGNHGDMTSGICVGAGNLDPRIRGMANGADLHVFDIGPYPQIVDAVSNYTNYGIVLVSTSYSQGCNEYTTDSQLGDQLIHDNPQFEFCFSAGNNGTGDCSYGAGAGWGNITGGYKEGKNVIACGNLLNTDVLDASSSRGPASDGRVKPDICSNGTDQLSTDQGNTYQVGGGTSAASPGVAGVLAQLYQAYKEINTVANPPSALIKACVLNSAEDLGNPGPDYQHGWGRINALRALTTLEDNRYLTDTISNGQTHTHTLTVPANVRQLRVMIYWHDYQGDPAASKALVNDLNMQVSDSASNVFNPWILDPTPVVSNLNATAVRGVDTLNNAEQVTIDDPASGNYSVTVNGFSVPQGPQEYYLVYEFRTDDITVTYPNGGEGFVPGETELIRWDAFGTSGTFDINYSVDSGTTWIPVTTGIAATARYYSWTVPSNVSDQVKVQVVRGSYSDASDTTFTIIPTPGNLHVAFSCPDSIGLAWNAVTNASGYDVSMLGVKYMDYIGTTTQNNFTVYNTQPNLQYWFSVKALGANGGKGRRALAIQKLPGIVACPFTLDGQMLKVISPATGVLQTCQNLSNVPVTIQIKNSGMNAIANFDVSYSFNGAAAVTETFTGNISAGATALFTFSQTVAMPSTGNYQVAAWLSITGDQNIYDDTSFSYVHVISGTTGSLPISQNFDGFTSCSTTSDCDATTCTLGTDWKNLINNTDDNIDWRVNSGTTPSHQSNTGPTNDHTLGNANGKYIYIEPSGGCNFQEADLMSRCINLAGAAVPELSFWYHMYGVSMGELHVDVITGGTVYEDVIPAKIGNKGNIWRKDSVMLNAFAGQVIAIRFRGITGNDYLSDMALDDINVFDRALGVEDLQSSNSVSVFPNPASGIFNYVLENTGAGKVDISVSDLLGKIIIKKSVSESGNNLRGTIDLSGYDKGIYMLTVRSEKFSRQVKLTLLD